jgi:hypothetical protein
MNKTDTGFASNAYSFSSLEQVTKAFDITIGELSEDKYSKYYPAIANGI